MGVRHFYILQLGVYFNLVITQFFDVRRCIHTHLSSTYSVAWVVDVLAWVSVCFLPTAVTCLKSHTRYGSIDRLINELID